MLVKCNRCRDVHEAAIPPTLATQFLASCPMCREVTMHRDASYEEIITYRQDATEAWQ